MTKVHATLEVRKPLDRGEIRLFCEQGRDKISAPGRIERSVKWRGRLTRRPIVTESTFDRRLPFVQRESHQHSAQRIERPAGRCWTLAINNPYAADVPKIDPSQPNDLKRS
jgi:hypothetical protein